MHWWETEEEKIRTRLYPLLLQGNELQAQKKYTEAIDVYDQVLAAHPEFELAALRSWAWYERGLAFYYKGRLVDALRSFECALELRPEDSTARAWRDDMLNELKNSRKRR